LKIAGRNVEGAGINGADGFQFLELGKPVGIGAEEVDVAPESKRIDHGDAEGGDGRITKSGALRAGEREGHAKGGGQGIPCGHSPMIDAVHDEATGRPDIAGILHRALPGHAVRSFAVMTGGLINAMYRVEVEGFEDPLVLRFYARDRTACQKEVDLHRLVAGSVPVPEVLY